MYKHYHIKRYLLYGSLSIHTVNTKQRDLATRSSDSHS